jgi:hypothetical protein
MWKNLRKTYPPNPLSFEERGENISPLLAGAQSGWRGFQDAMKSQSQQPNAR